MRKRVVAILILCAWPIHITAAWFGPANYEECILESMKGVSSDRAAAAIVGACREKFSKECEKLVEVEGRTYQVPCKATDTEIRDVVANLSNLNSKSSAETPRFWTVKVISTAISALVLAALLFVIFKIITIEHHQNLKKALKNPTEYPKWKQVGIRRLNELLNLLEKHFADSLDIPFNDIELNGISAFSPPLGKLLITHKGLSKRDSISLARKTAPP